MLWLLGLAVANEMVVRVYVPGAAPVVAVFEDIQVGAVEQVTFSGKARQTYQLQVTVLEPHQKDRYTVQFELSRSEGRRAAQLVMQPTMDAPSGRLARVSMGSQRFVSEDVMQFEGYEIEWIIQESSTATP